MKIDIFFAAIRKANIQLNIFIEPEKIKYEFSKDNSFNINNWENTLKQMLKEHIINENEKKELNIEMYTLLSKSNFLINWESNSNNKILN